MKSIRKILTVICTVLMFIAMFVPTNVFANEMDENNLYYKQYEQFQEEGVLGTDVTYDDWRSMVNSSFELEKILENSTEFKDVTYCSKIVWQAYYYGPSSHEANGPTIGYRMPYDLLDTIHNLSYEHTY